MFGHSDSPLLSDFLNRLERVPWFENIGKPVGPNVKVQQIFSWEEWPGPEESRCIELCLRQQSLYDEIFSTASDISAQLADLWERIHAIVFRDAISKVPYDADQDTWHGPTAAVWHAAWTAGLMGLCLFLGRPIPSELHQQWKWFAEGHWPCGWVGDFPQGQLLIY
jgi:hypothetical protein